MQGFFGPIKYLAARRVLINHGIWKEEIKRILYGNWDNEWNEQFRLEYQKLRVDWYWQSIEFIDQYKEWAVRELDNLLMN